MRKINLLYVVLIACLVGLAGQVTSSAQQGAADQGDLVVTLEHVGGKTEQFGNEISRLELILDRDGQLNRLHLITKTGDEDDTHMWFNVDNLVSVKYRFLAITGKGKVTVRTLRAPLEPSDYR